MPKKNLSPGDKLGRLTLERKIKKVVKGKKRLYWVCNCDCGNTSLVIQYALTKDVSPTRSCGCLHREIMAKRHTKHGLSDTYKYDVFKYLKGRYIVPWKDILEFCSKVPVSDMMNLKMRELADKYGLVKRPAKGESNEKIQKTS